MLAFGSGLGFGSAHATCSRLGVFHLEPARQPLGPCIPPEMKNKPQPAAQLPIHPAYLQDVKMANPWLEVVCIAAIGGSYVLLKKPGASTGGTNISILGTCTGWGGLIYSMFQRNQVVVEKHVEEMRVDIKVIREHQEGGVQNEERN